MIFPALKPVRFVQNAVQSALSGIFSKPQMTNFILLLSGIIIGQCLNLSYIEKLLLGRKSDNAFSWFLSHAKLNPDAIWQAILMFAVQAFHVGPCAGHFILGDTIEKHSKFCRFIQGVCTLYDHATGAYVKGECYVFLYFAISDKIRFPIGWKIYVPNSKTKYVLALELIDEALLKGFHCSYVLVDSWFAIAPFLDSLHRKGLRYTCELKSNNKIWARCDKKSLLEIYSWRWLIEEFFGDEKKLLDFEGARMRNYQAEAITLLTLSCADLLLSLEIFRHSQVDSQSRTLTFSSMIAKVQEENIQTLPEALSSEEKGEGIAIKWLGVLRKESTRYRRQRRMLYKLLEEDDFENRMTG